MERYRVFLSSPTDVQLERDRAEIVLKRLNAERIDHPQFEIVRWEHDYYRAESDFQAQIPKPAECQLVICMFWKRLGSELPPIYARPDGTIPTGTEYEFENAMQAAAGRPEKLPDVLVYRKTAEVTFAADKLELERAQYERFMAFWQRWFRNEKGHFVAGFQTFIDPDEFERLLEKHLRAWLQDREQNVTWTKGSPYRGLEPFDVEHAPIFFGRRREVERTRARLLASAMAGRPFLLITGASGSGKSSLARAGLIPRLGQVGGMSTLAAALRWCILTPGQIAGDWAGGLAKALLEKTALGTELAQGDFRTAEELKAQLARADRSSVLPLTKALERASAAIAAAEKRTSPPPVVLLILIDQLEELFAWPKTEAVNLLRFLRSLADAPGSPVWLVATMRSDFQHRLVEYDLLQALAGRVEVKGPDEAERTLELALPSQADLRDMVLLPARAAGLDLEVSKDGKRDLAHIIEAESRPEAMPAVQFLMSELYARRRDNVMTLAAFDELGGVGGVMARRGEDVYYAVDAPARNAFPRIVRALVTQVRGDVPPSVRRVAEQTFANDRPAGRLVAALNDARLIISDRGEMRFTHDSILKGWKRLRDQIGEEQRMFEARERLELLCRHWVEAGRSAGARPSKLLLQGFQLAEGRELVEKWGAAALTDKQPELPKYIATSDTREKRARRITQAVGWSVATVLAVLAWQINIQRRVAEEARREAQASLYVANSRSELRDGRVMQAIDNAAKAYAELPREGSRSALAAALFELSPHLAATFPVGWEAGEALAWTAPDAIVYATAAGGGELRALSPSRREGAVSAPWPMPKVKRTQDGNRASIRALRPVAADRMLAVLDNGAVAQIERGASAARLRPAARETTLFTAHAAAIGRSGTVIVTAGADGNVTLTECAPTGSGPLDCKDRMLPDVRGKVVALSPDEKRIAVGDEAGRVAIYDRAWSRKAEPVTVGGTLLALAWAEQGDLIAAGSTEGDIVVLDARGDAPRQVEKQSLAGAPITAIAWSPAGTQLAFACYGRIVCHWPLAAAADGAITAPPVRYFEGHENGITRVSWSPDGKQVASVAADGTLRAWSIAQNMDAGYALYAEAPAQMFKIAASPDGRFLAAGAKDGTIRIWDTATLALVRSVKPSWGTDAAALAWNRAGVLVAAHEGRGLSIVAADPSRPVREIAYETDVDARVEFAGSDSVIAMPQHGDKRIALIDISQPQPVIRHIAAIGQDQVPWGVGVDPAGKTLFASYTETQGDIQAWDLATLKSQGPLKYTLSEPRNPIAPGSLPISSDGRWLASSGGDNLIRVYDLQRRETLRALAMDGSSNEPRTVGFSPDGSRLAALASDDRIYVWSMREDGTPRFAVFKALPNRSAAAGTDKRQEVASWMSWLSNEDIAIATGGSAIYVIGLSPARWRSRLASPGLGNVALPAATAMK